MKEVGEGEGHGDEHVRVGLIEDHASYLRVLHSLRNSSAESFGSLSGVRTLWKA